MNNITKEDLAAKLYDHLITQHSDELMPISKASAARLLNAIIEMVAKELEAGNKVIMQDLGNFEPVFKRARRARNVIAGETILVPECYSLRLKPSKKIKRRLTENLLP